MIRVLTIVTALVFVVELRHAAAQYQLTEDRFQELMSSVEPAEQPDSIEWISDLLKAQKVALRQKKPMFIWSMDGHPLGCT